MDMASVDEAQQDVARVRSLPSAALTVADQHCAAKLTSLIADAGSGRTQLRLSRADGDAIDLAPAMVTVLEEAARLVAGGVGVAVVATYAELTSQKAADILGVSRQYMVRLLDRGDIPSFRVGSHRRVRVEDLATYRAQRDQARRSALATLTADAQAAGGYDAPAKFGPPRKG